MIEPRETTPWQRVKELAGEKAALKLSAQFGGRRLYVPVTMGEHHPIAQTIGLKAAEALSSEFALERIEVPLTRSKRRQIVALGKEGLGPEEIRRRVGCTRRYVFMVLAEERAALEAPSPQLRLL